MAALIKALVKEYNYAFDELSYPPLQSWFLMGSPWPMLIVIFSYQYFSVSLGPRLMKNVNSFNIDRVIQIYNICQVLLCIYMLKEFVYHAWVLNFNWLCQPVFYSDHPSVAQLDFLAWLYLMTKVIDLLDTVFFVLRKKNNQITFLHVYHHSGMVFATWIGVNFFPNGQMMSVGFVNAIVHSVMYTYYFLTNYNPEYKKKIWWKKHVTQLQITQFLILFVHQGIVLIQPTCNIPRLPTVLFLTQNTFFFLLFLDFYIKAYKTPKLKVESDNASVPGTSELKNIRKLDLNGRTKA